MRTIIVNVTRAMLEVGERNNCVRCPLAMALNTATGDSWRVEFGAYAFRYTEGSYLSGAEPDWHGHLPIKAQYFLYDWDKGYECHPFSFEVTLPEVTP